MLGKNEKLDQFNVSTKKKRGRNQIVYLAMRLAQMTAPTTSIQLKRGVWKPKRKL